MALIDNIGSLVGKLVQPDQNEESKQLANRAGVDTSSFGKIAAIGLPLLLQGMNRNAKSQEGRASLNEALNQHQTRNNYDSLNEFAKNVDTEDGDKILNHVLSEDKEEVSQGLAQQLGVNSDTVKRTLAVLAPLVIKYLADRKQEKNLGQEEIQGETEQAAKEAAQQVKQGPQSGGLLGGLLSNLTGNDSSKKNNTGLLGDIFQLLK